MGGASSRLITRSAPKDALANLTTTLDDLTRWEDKAAQLKDCIDGVQYPLTPNAAFGDRELATADSVLECVADLSGQGGARSTLTPAGISATGVDFTQDAGHRSTLQKLEDAVDRERQLSRLVSSVDFPASHLFTSYVTNSLMRHLQEDRGSSSSAKLGTAELPSGDPSNASAQELSRHEEIVSKYWYIHRMLQMMLNSAEHCYKLRDRLEHFGHMLKPKRFNLLNPMDQLKMRQTNDATYRNIQESMLTWDKARLAVRWMIRDYHLVVGSHLVQRSMRELNSLRGEFQRALMSNPGVAQKMQSLDELLYRLNVSALNLDLQRFLNEHDSLNAALNYHDKDLKGCLTTKDCTNMSASLFAQLDANKDGRISYDDMRGSLMKSVDEVQRREIRIAQLRAEGDDLRQRAASGPVNNFAVLGATNDSEIARIGGDMMEHQNFLKSAWSFFHNSFGVHVFGVRPGQLVPNRLSLDMMRAAIAQVAASALSDPLTEQETRGLARCGIDLNQQVQMQSEPYPQPVNLSSMTAMRGAPAERMQQSSLEMTKQQQMTAKPAVLDLSDRDKFASSQPQYEDRSKMSTAQLAALAPAGQVTRGEGPMKESYEVTRSPSAPEQHPVSTPLSVRDAQGQPLPVERKYQSALSPVAMTDFQLVPSSQVESKDYQAMQQSQELSRPLLSSPAGSRDYVRSPTAEKDYSAYPVGSNLSAKEHESLSQEYMSPAHPVITQSSSATSYQPALASSRELQGVKEDESLWQKTKHAVGLDTNKDQARSATGYGPGSTAYGSGVSHIVEPVVTKTSTVKTVTEGPPSSIQSAVADPTNYDLRYEPYTDMSLGKQGLSGAGYGEQQYSSGSRGLGEQYGGCDTQKYTSSTGEYGSSTKHYGAGTTMMCLDNSTMGSSTSDSGYQSKGNETLTLSQALGSSPSPLTSEFNKGDAFDSQLASSSSGQQFQSNRVYIPIHAVEEEESKY